MLIKEKIPVFIIAGPSAIGKSYVAKSIVKKDEKFSLLRSATTREKREFENDSEYIYMTEEEFLSAVERGQFLENVTYAGNMYGTPFSEVERVFSEGKIPLLILDIKGTEKLVKDKRFKVFSAYLFGDMDMLEKRLYKRYLEENPTNEGFLKYYSRKEENIRNYLEIESFCDLFFTFIENNRTVEECRDELISAFDGFLKGNSRDDKKNYGIAKMLRLEAQQKAKNK